MKTKFINIEGLHGCGKSTTAWKLNEKLREQGFNSRVYLEVDMDYAQRNPCDLRFLALLNEEEYKNLTIQYPEQSSLIESLVEKIDDEYYQIYYPDISDDCNELLDKLKSYQAYEGRLNSDTFVRIMFMKFNDFVENAVQDDIVYIFESVLFQHIINELLRFSNLSETYISECITKLTNILKPLNPILFHLRTDNTKGIIDKVASERLSDNYDLYPDWIDWMIEYVKNSSYGEKNNVQNREGLMDFFYKRADIEEKVFSLLDIEKHIINIDPISKETLNSMVYSILRDESNKTNEFKIK
ncbi:hypothetical protein NST99_20985 [Paenibacillus sp. FSL L8-0470]|uniref:hypothetical protein n=1 Tax=Paenibacillus sp. FSL L8-0470 TaxID=2954688 RepID=UPI0030F5637F